MSTIYFECDSEIKNQISKSVFQIVKQHYLNTVAPPPDKTFERESDEVYDSRMEQLMKDQLYRSSDSEEGVTVEFDSTEDAGYAIAENVYKTGNRYRDYGLTNVGVLLEEITHQFENVKFTAEIYIQDKYVDEECTYVYDGEKLSNGSEDGFCECVVCGGEFPEEECVFENGEWMCSECYERLRSKKYCF